MLRTHFDSFFPKIVLSFFVLFLSVGAYANVDMGYEQRACSEKKDFVQPVDNGQCYGVIIGRGIENIKLR
jgi:hypothetical protein